eukprot:GILI01011905.1.p1 GENE.GILI01011905.1~~GILI01011905.1.p1  ORF type:complete len:457 (+),score=84.28 GILI01011905.1:50-1420(+)
MPLTMEKPSFTNSPIVSPSVQFGTSPFHFRLSNGNGDSHTASYCFLTEKDKTMSESYDLYYKGSLMEGFAFTCQEQWPNATAVKGPQELTVSGLYARVCDVGRGYSELGLNPGDRIIIYADESPFEWFLSTYGLWSHGLYCAVVNTPKHLEVALRETKAKVVLSSGVNVQTVADALKELNISNARIVTTAPTATEAQLGEAFMVTFAQLEARGKQAREENQRTMQRPEPDQTAMIVYTDQSHTNGIVLSHGNLYAAVKVTSPRLLEMTATSVLTTAIVEPLSHITPYILGSACLLTGGFITFGFAGQPTLVACTPSLLGKVSVAFSNPTVVLVYNPQSEEGDQGATHDLTSAYWYSPIAASGVGLMRFTEGNAITMMPGTELRLRNLTSGNDGARTGEVMLKGPCVSKGYFSPNLDIGELDRSILLEGWMPTGDVAEVSATGDIRIVGRLRLSEQT